MSQPGRATALARCRLIGRSVALICVSGGVALLVATPSPLTAQPRLALDEIASFGVEGGDRRFEFGEISGIAVDDSRGHIYLIDRLNYRLSVFTRAGVYVTSTGKRGRGPGEFQDIRTVAGPIGRDQAVYVNDHLNGRLSRYALRGDTLVQLGEIRGSIPGAACHMNHHMFFFTFRGGSVVQKVDTAGRILSSFGAPFRNDHPASATVTANGRIACGVESGSVFLGSTVFPIVRRYSADTGSLVWEATIPGMTLAVITHTNEGLPVFRAPQGKAGWDIIVSVIPAPGGVLLVQIGSNEHTTSRNDIVRVRTVVLNIADGRLIGVRTDLPRLDFGSGGYAYAAANDPFPRVRVYRWR